MTSCFQALLQERVGSGQLTVWVVSHLLLLPEGSRCLLPGAIQGVLQLLHQRRLGRQAVCQVSEVRLQRLDCSVLLTRSQYVSLPSQTGSTGSTGQRMAGTAVGTVLQAQNQAGHCAASPMCSRRTSSRYSEQYSEQYSAHPPHCKQS